MKATILFLLLSPIFADDWSLTGVTGPGPDEWAETYPTCNGTRPDARQSPIDVPKHTLYNPSLDGFNFVGYDSLTSDDMVMINNGYSGMVLIKPSSIGKASFTGGGYTGTYYASRFHIHWGETDDHGSDHSFQGKFFAASLHIGHYNSRYSDIITSTSYPDGLVALAIPFKLAKNNNSAVDAYINALQNIPEKGDQVSFGTNFADFMPNSTSKFYRYQGSMPLPPCKETVVWTLFEKPNTISSTQLAQLRIALYDGDQANNIKVTHNNRPIQPLNGRIVERNFDDGESNNDDNGEDDNEQ